MLEAVAGLAECVDVALLETEELLEDCLEAVAVLEGIDVLVASLCMCICMSNCMSILHVYLHVHLHAYLHAHLHVHIH